MGLSAQQSSNTSIFDIHGSPLQLVCSLLPLKDVLKIELTCHTLKERLRALPGSFWKEALRKLLPKHHALLARSGGVYSRADIISRLSTKQALYSGRCQRWYDCTCVKACC